MKEIAGSMRPSPRLFAAGSPQAERPLPARRIVSFGSTATVGAPTLDPACFQRWLSLQLDETRRFNGRYRYSGSFESPRGSTYAVGPGMSRVTD